jgi:regulator of protease activity HflC (stomatin/prohibitin superfamily)
MDPFPINHPLVQFLRRAADIVVSPFGGLLAVLLAIAIFGCAYTVDETEQVVLTQFGRPIGEPINAATDSSGAGLHF